MYDVILEEVLEGYLGTLEAMDPSHSQYEKVRETTIKLAEALNKADKVTADVKKLEKEFEVKQEELKLKERELDLKEQSLELEAKTAKAKRRENGVNTIGGFLKGVSVFVVGIAGVVVPAYMYGAICEKSLKIEFEDEEVPTSTVFRGLVNKIKP